MKDCFLWIQKSLRARKQYNKTSLNPSTLEGKIVRIADKIAYVNHDIDDGIRAGVLNEDALPKECTDILGHSTSCNQVRLNGELREQFLDESVDHRRGTIKDTTLHTLKGIASNKSSWSFNMNRRQL